MLRLFHKKIKDKGSIGEKIVSKKLNKLDNKYYVINDLLLATEKVTSQIDHVVISIYGIFVIETKNYSGTIYGNDVNYNWQQKIGNKYNKFRNPIKQNYSHIKAIQYILPELKDKDFLSIIVFNRGASLKINTKYNVIKVRKLKKTIKKHKDILLEATEVEYIYETLLKANIKSNRMKRKHVKNIEKSIKKTNKKINKKRCPRCNGKLKKIKGVNGYFYGCKNYPKCRFTKEID